MLDYRPSPEQEKGAASDSGSKQVTLGLEQIADHTGQGVHGIQYGSRDYTHRPFEETHQDELRATDEAFAPAAGFSGMLARLKRVVIGRPLPMSQLEGERLSKKIALPIFSSDAISSVAYATEASLMILIGLGGLALYINIYISVAIVLLLALLTLSYRQVITKYPSGGGAYVVSIGNLGVFAGLSAGVALLVDYILTVSVSVSSGVAALTSVLPGLFGIRTIICLLFVLILTLINLRGVRESGNIFSIPTYLFIFSMYSLFLVSAYRLLVLHEPLHGPVNGVGVVPPASEAISIFLILKGFSSGCSALTGVEAISNGVPSFTEPAPQNAKTTMVWMAIILGTLFGGMTVLTYMFHVLPDPDGKVTLLSLIAEIGYGNNTFGYLAHWNLQLWTMFILVLAANTSENGFPRLAQILADDSFLPKRFRYRGDRLSYSSGIILLGILASVLIVAFKGTTDALIPLYAIGVFMGFTLCQVGMVRRWLRDRDAGWRRGMTINACGAVVCALVTLIFAVTKFLDGAWIVIVVIPSLIALLWGMHRHYKRVEAVNKISPEELHQNFVVALEDHKKIANEVMPSGYENIVIVPIARFDRMSCEAINYALRTFPNVRILHVSNEQKILDRLKSEWLQIVGSLASSAEEDNREKKAEQIGTPGDTNKSIIFSRILSPYSSVMLPFRSYIDLVQQQHPQATLTVVIPELVVQHWWDHLLHNQTAYLIRRVLQHRPHVALTSIPYQLTEYKG